MKKSLFVSLIFLIFLNLSGCKSTNTQQSSSAGLKNIIVVTDDNFQEEVLESEKPVLVDFWAPWCSPCKIIAPHIESIAEEYRNCLKVAKLNVDYNRKTQRQYRANAIPLLVFFKDGQPVDMIRGAVSKMEIERSVRKLCQGG